MRRFALLLCLLPSLLSVFSANNDRFEIVKESGRYRVAVNGASMYIKGVGGTNRLDIASANGANAFRTWGGTVEAVKKNVEMAKANNMYIMQGIALTKDVNAYYDEKYKNEKREEVRLLAETFKECPQIFAWGIGNEVELGKANVAEMWKFIDELARIIKSIDKKHLVANVLCIPFALDSVAAYAPNLDYVGINSYGSIDKLGEMIENTAYKGPFMVTEWGPSGFWEMPATAWKAPIEQNSEEKRIVYEERYNNYILSNPRCMGSFVFLWGQKEERTPTWFSMFVEGNVDGLPLKGEKTPMVEAMQRVWTGKEPTQTAPVLKKFTLNGKEAIESVTVKPNATLKGEAFAVDKEGGKLTYVWEVLKEATVLGFGGSYEPRPERVGQVALTEENNHEISIGNPGNYRLYVYVLDNTGYVATANMPFRVE